MPTRASQWKSPFPAKRFLVAVGTRAEAIKLAPVICEFQTRIGRPDGPEEVFVCATGQREDIVEESLAQFGVRVDLNLSLLTPRQSLAAAGARILSRLEAVLHEVKPDWVLVQGDTVTSSMAALAAFYAGVRVAHIEAGVRSPDLDRTLPEEFNRRMIAIVSAMHFAPTPWTKRNLLREGVDERSILVSGNTGIDAMLATCERLGMDPGRDRPQRTGPVRVLVVAHRRESLDQTVANVCEAILNLNAEHPNGFLFLWPLPANLQTRGRIELCLAGVKTAILRAAAPYDELLGYLQQSDAVLTDSGGLQEEAPSFGKPVLILRDATERPEGVGAGQAWLAGTQPEQIEDALRSLMDRIAQHRTAHRSVNPYGDGQACTRIADYFAGLPVREFEATPGAARRGEQSSLAEAHCAVLV